MIFILGSICKIFLTYEWTKKIHHSFASILLYITTTTIIIVTVISLFIIVLFFFFTFWKSYRTITCKKEWSLTSFLIHFIQYLSIFVSFDVITKNNKTKLLKFVFYVFIDILLYYQYFGLNFHILDLIFFLPNNTVGS